MPWTCGPKCPFWVDPGAPYSSFCGRDEDDAFHGYPCKWSLAELEADAERLGRAIAARRLLGDAVEGERPERTCECRGDAENTRAALNAENTRLTATVVRLEAEVRRLREAMPEPAALNLLANWLDHHWRSGSAPAAQLREMAETLRAALEGKANA